MLGLKLRQIIETQIARPAQKYIQPPCFKADTRYLYENSFGLKI